MRLHTGTCFTYNQINKKHVHTQKRSNGFFWFDTRASWVKVVYQLKQQHTDGTAHMEFVAKIPVAVQETVIEQQHSAPYSPALFEDCKRRSVKQRGELFLLNHLLCAEAWPRLSDDINCFGREKTLLYKLRRPAHSLLLLMVLSLASLRHKGKGLPAKMVHVSAKIWSALTSWEMTHFRCLVAFYRVIIDEAPRSARMKQQGD